MSDEIDWKAVHPEPEYQLEAWLAYRPEELEKDPDEVIAAFAAKWELELDDETLAAMHKTFADMKVEVAEGIYCEEK